MDDSPTTDRITPAAAHPGLRDLFAYPLMSAIIDRRTRRVARGTSIEAGPISHVSENAPSPLSPLEEAVLIVSTGLTGSATMHDVPTRNAEGQESFSAPLINILSRSASTIDNSHAVSFFLINDEGTFLIKKKRNHEALEMLARRPPRWEDWTEDDWLSGSISRGAGPTISSGTGRFRTGRAPRSCFRSSTCPGRLSTS